jgi:parallel beta-helix repeat protein
VGTDGMRIDAVCGPATSRDDISCVPGSVIDSYSIGTPPPPPPPSSSTLYVDQANPNCSDTGNGSASLPFCTIVKAATAAVSGKTVIVSSGTYSGQVSPNSGTASAPVVFAAAPGASVTVTQGGAKDKYGFYLSSRSYVTVLGFNVTGTTSDGLYVSKSDHISLIGNHVSNSGKPQSGQTAKGIRLGNTTNSLVSGNTVDHNTDYGIYLDGSSGSTIMANRVYANARVFERAASGIRLYASPSNVVSSNVTHDNEDSGIELYTGSNNNLVVNNVTYNNGDHGIDTLNSTGNKHISNSVYNNQTAGINAEGGSTGTTIRNNISVDNGIGSTRTDSNIRVDAQSTSGTSMDYDLVYLRTPVTLLIWGSTKYTSLNTFKSATGQEPHGTQADPKWAAPGAGDLHLSAGSPAIDAADSGAPGATTSDADGNPRVDDPLTTNRGAGSRLFDDRGAYEFQPEVTDLPPAASLTVTPASGTAPLDVTADASGSSDTDATPIASYKFDFGDGSPVVGPQPGATASHTYTSAGTYTVKVTVTDTADQASTATTEVIVRSAPDAPPAAALTVTPASGTAPLGVSADASGSSDTDATPIASYKFDFGDGSPVVGPQPGATASHTYTDAGTYTVKVTVTDTADQPSTATRQVTVTAPDAPPTAALSVTPASGTAPLDVTADASGSSDTDSTPIASYKFDFGDGSAVVGPQSAATASHTYTDAGTYTVKVTVTDTADQASTATTQVTVTSAPDAPPAAALTVTPGSGTAPLAVNADASASTDGDDTPIASYKFDFGDGSAVVGPQAGATASHTYSAAGTFTVTVTVTDTADQPSTATRQVTVTAPDAPPAAALTVTPGSGTAPLAVSADASGSSDTDATPIASYKFDFGDGSAVVGPQSAATASHTYTSAGTYTVKVTVTDTANQPSTATTQVTVTAPDAPPAATLTVTPASGLAPLPVTADASGSSDTDATPIASYKFDFGDDSAVVGPQAGATASHTYSAAGTFRVTVTVRDTAGLSSTATSQVTVQQNLVGNSGFETNTTGWNTSGSGTGVTLTRVAGGHSGGWAAQVTNTSTSNTTCLLNDSPNWVAATSPGSYTGSIWVRADKAGATLNLRFREYNGSALVDSRSTSATLTTSWQLVSVTYTPLSPGSTNLDFNAYVPSASAPPGTCFYADDAVITR